jgi:hypothetical protein
MMFKLLFHELQRNANYVDRVREMGPSATCSEIKSCTRLGLFPDSGSMAGEENRFKRRRITRGDGAG